MSSREEPGEGGKWSVAAETSLAPANRRTPHQDTAKCHRHNTLQTQTHRQHHTHTHLHTLGFCSTEKASYQPAKRDRMLKSVTLPHLRRPCSKMSVMCGERQRRTALEAFSSSDGSGTLVCSEYTQGEKGTKRYPSHLSHPTPHIPPLTSTPHVTLLTSHPSQHTVRYTLTSPHRDQRILTHLTLPHTSPHTPLTHHHVPLHKPSSSQPWCP